MAKQVNKETLLIIGAIAVGGYILYKPFKALFETLDITQSQTEKDVQQQQTGGVKSPFSPLFWRQYKNAHIIKQAQAKAKAQVLYNSITNTGPKPDTIIAIFKTLQYKTQVSFLADIFAQMYKTDLLDYLQNGRSNFLVHNALRENDLSTILNLVNGMKTK
jgi:hypothetical protein